MLLCVRCIVAQCLRTACSTRPCHENVSAGHGVQAWCGAGSAHLTTRASWRTPSLQTCEIGVHEQERRV